MGCLNSKPTTGASASGPRLGKASMPGAAAPPPPPASRPAAPAAERAKIAKGIAQGINVRQDKWDLRKNLSGVASKERQQMVREHQLGSPVKVADLYNGVPELGNNSAALGTGGTASVFPVTHKITKVRYALKVVDFRRFNSEQKAMLLKEVGIIKMLDHPNTIKVIEIFETEDALYEVLEMCDGGDISDVLHKLPGTRMTEDRVRPLVSKMIRGIAYLHANNLVHRDIKLDNFIFTSKNPIAELKLIDFGLSRQYFEGDKMTRTTGTPAYMAPELITNDYTEISDLWSLGVTIFVMVCGAFPFDAPDVLGLISKLSKDPEALKANVRGQLTEKGLSEGFCNFLLKMFEVDITKRCTAVEALNDPWIKPQSKQSRRQSQFAMARNMGSFAGMNELQKTAFTAVSVGLTNAEVHELNDLFEEMDTNRDGVLDWDEFFTAMTTVTGQAEDQLKATFNAIDQDGTGKIKYSEFVASAIAHQETDMEDAIEAAFYRLDISDTGHISVDDLEHVLPSTMSAADVQALLDRADPNHDGQLDLLEFRALMKFTDQAMQVIEKEQQEAKAAVVKANASNPEMRRGLEVLQVTDI